MHKETRKQKWTWKKIKQGTGTKRKEKMDGRNSMEVDWREKKMDMEIKVGGENGN